MTPATQRHRQSIRLPDYNYASVGVYYVTVCVRERSCLFGEIVDGQMHVNALGQIVVAEWQRTPEVRPQIAPDEFVVMPNHVHVIFAIVPHPANLGNMPDRERGRGELQFAPTQSPRAQTTSASSFRSPSQTVGAVIRGYKAATTKSVNLLCGAPGLPLWQRNYYEHIVRDEAELDRIRRYVSGNPGKWHEDDENPERRS
jgi:REP element-mobilizing transposase RayT